MIRVDLKLFGILGRTADCGPRAALEFPLPLTTRQVLESVGLRPDSGWVVVIDDVPSSLDTVIAQNVMVSVFPRVAGG